MNQRGLRWQFAKSAIATLQETAFRNIRKSARERTILRRRSIQLKCKKLRRQGGESIMKNSLQQSNIIENLKRYKRAEGISGNLGLPLRRQMIITFLARIVRESSIQARLRSTSRSVKTWLTSQNQLIGIQEFHKRPLCKWTKNCRNNFLLQTLKFNKGKMNFLLHPKQANY